MAMFNPNLKARRSVFVFALLFAAAYLFVPPFHAYVNELLLRYHLIK